MKINLCNLLKGLEWIELYTIPFGYVKLERVYGDNMLEISLYDINKAYCY